MFQTGFIRDSVSTSKYRFYARKSKVDGILFVQEAPEVTCQLTVNGSTNSRLYKVVHKNRCLSQSLRLIK